MCSRYSLTSPPEAVRSYFETVNEPEFPPRYNIAPTQPVLIVRHDAKRRRELALVRWGLLPSWVKDPHGFSTLINARSEGAAEKPAFRGGMRHRRCLVPADAFYEWTGTRGRRRPHLLRLRSGGPFAMAGIWEHWLGADGSELETMAILTVPSNRPVSALHDRMPALLPPSAFEAWLDCRSGSAVEAAELLRPAPEDLLEIRRGELSPQRPAQRRAGSSRAGAPDLALSSRPGAARIAQRIWPGAASAPLSGRQYASARAPPAEAGSRSSAIPSFDNVCQPPRAACLGSDWYGLQG
jgi:putative SOS response-associated peptidase YedK